MGGGGGEMAEQGGGEGSVEVVEVFRPHQRKEEKDTCPSYAQPHPPWGSLRERSTAAAPPQPSQAKTMAASSA